MKCPNCDETLVMSDRNGVEIDYCPKCRGVWLDRGELDKIIERTQNHSSSFYSDSDRRYNEDDHKYKKKKKDSFLGDLFDF
jgi:Zn-finger nucleic acid-binding protein